MIDPAPTPTRAEVGVILNGDGAVTIPRATLREMAAENQALRERAEAAEQRVNELEGLCMQLEAEAGNAAAQLAEIVEDDADLNRIADERKDGPFVPVELVTLTAARRAEAAAWNDAIEAAEAAYAQGFAAIRALLLDAPTEGEA